PNGNITSRKIEPPNDSQPTGLVNSSTQIGCIARLLDGGVDTAIVPDCGGTVLSRIKSRRRPPAQRFPVPCPAPGGSPTIAPECGRLRAPPRQGRCPPAGAARTRAPDPAAGYAGCPDR